MANPATLKVERRKVLKLLGAAAVAGMASGPVFAQRSAVVRMIIPFTAGGPTDIIGRAVAQQLSKAWGRPVVVENRPGAGSSIGAQEVARAKPDGNTLLLTASSHTMSAPLLPKLTYDPIEDFTPLTIAGFQPFVLAVSANDPIKDLKSFVAAASEAKEPLSMGVAGIGNASHYVGLMMQRQKNIRLLFVPYSGSSMLMTSLIGGEVRAGLLNTTVAMPLIKDGRIRPLGVSSEKRWRQLPDVPTFNEVGFSDFEVSAWYGFLAPAGMPADMAKKIDHDLRAALETPEVARLIRESGLDPLNWTPEEFGRRMRAESRLSYSLIEEAGLKPGQ